MSIRATFRYVPNTFVQAPESGVTAELFCTFIGCGTSSGPQTRPEAAQEWALGHTGLHPGHGFYRREYTDN